MTYQELDQQEEALGEDMELRAAREQAEHDAKRESANYEAEQRDQIFWLYPPRWVDSGGTPGLPHRFEPQGNKVWTAQMDGHEIVAARYLTLDAARRCYARLLHAGYTRQP
jgi:hypothetical protein